jgi:hypothetical protein
MSNFCTACGKALNPASNFCIACGAASGRTAAPPNVCPSCGVQLVSDTTPFCTHCGTSVKASAQAPAQAVGHALASSSQSNQPASSAEAPFQVLSPTDLDGIRQRLRKYSEYGEAECVHCGYTGHMGIVKRKKPLHENGLFKLLAFSGGGAVRNWYAASAFLGGVAKIVLECPACGSLWQKQVGDRPSMFMIGR